MENYEETQKPAPPWKADELFKRKKIDGKLWLPARGDDGAQLLIIAPCPLFSDLEEGHIMSGDYGVELAAALKLAGLHERDYCVTTLVKYPVGLKITAKDIAACAEHLEQEIAAVKPKLIMTLGAEVFKYLMKSNIGQADYVGEIVDSTYGKVMPNHSLGTICNQDPKKKGAFQDNFVLAKQFLSGGLAYDTFEYIVVNDPEVNRYILQKYMDEGKWDIGYDMEWYGARFPDKEVVYTFQYSCEKGKAIILDLSVDGVCENKELLDSMKMFLEHPNAKRMGWNIRADDKRLILRGFNIPDESLAFDGMKAVAFFDSRDPKGLETGIRFFTKYPPYYVLFNKALRTHKLKKEELSKLKFLEPELFYTYCAGDAVSHLTACQNMRDTMLKTLPKEVTDYYFTTYLPVTGHFTDMELTGIPIDIEVIEDITNKYSNRYTQLYAELQVLAKEYGYEAFNPYSSVQKKELLFEKMKLTPAYYTKAGKAAKPHSWYEKQKPKKQKEFSPSSNGKSLSTLKFQIAELLVTEPDNEDLKKKQKIIKNILDLMRVGVFAKKFLTKQGTSYEEIEDGDEEAEDPLRSSYWASICDDGAIHASFFECLDNFRASSKVNVQNPASKVLSHIPGIFNEVNQTPPRNIRHIFYPGKKDWHWVECDIAGADLAIAAFLSGDEDYKQDILMGGFHTKKMKEYFKDETLTKKDTSKYVTSKSITFRVAYTSELQAAAEPIQAEIYAESGDYIDIKMISYALDTWTKYKRYMEYREECKIQARELGYVLNARGIPLKFGTTQNPSILAGWQNQALAYPVASELALFMWDICVKMRKQLKKDNIWMHWCKPVNSVHDASYWIIHKDLMADNYFPEVCKFFFTKECKIATGDTLGMELSVSDRWKGEEHVFDAETAWNFEKKCWDWKK